MKLPHCVQCTILSILSPIPRKKPNSENLIKRYRPKYNILLKDDKTYPYPHQYPGGLSPYRDVRKIQKDGARYFGTYVNVGFVRGEYGAYMRLFPSEPAREVYPDKKQRSALLPYRIMLCTL